MADKLDIIRCLNALNKKNYNFYKEITAEEKKQFSLYVFLRWASNTNQANLYNKNIRKLNNNVNKHFFTLSKNHPDLMWKLFATVPDTQRNSRYSYLAAGKKEKVNKLERLIADTYPAMKMEEVELAAKLMTKEEKQEFLKGLGLDKKQQKEYQT
jgi:uncharacterized circularly permuted ATP-grasp superfamily protein